MVFALIPLAKKFLSASRVSVPAALEGIQVRWV